MRYVLKLDDSFYVANATECSDGVVFTQDRKDAVRFWTRFGAVEYLQNNVPSIFWHDITPVNLWRLF